MKRIILLLFISSLSTWSLAQNPLSAVDQLIQQNQTDKALVLIDSELSKKISDDLSFQYQDKKAEVLITQGKLNEAETILSDLQKKTLTDFQKGIVLTTLGSLNMNKGRFDLALEDLQIGTGLFQKSGTQSTKEAAQNLAVLAIVYNAT